MNTTHFNLSALSVGELNKLVEDIEKEVRKRKNEKFNQLIENFLKAYEDLVTTYPCCCIHIGRVDMNGKEIDLNSIGFSKNDFNFRMN